MSLTQISEQQIDLRTIFSPEQLLLSNGYEVVPPGSVSDLLVNELDSAEIEALFGCLEYEPSRNELRRYIYRETEDVKQSKTENLVKVQSFQRDRKKFDNSLEWFIGELMVRKFAAFSAARGITVKNIIRGTTGTESGDYDALCVLRNLRIAYFECKSGTFDETHVLKCYERMQSLNCQFSIMIAHKPFTDENLKWISQKLRLPMLYNHILYRINILGIKSDFIYDFNNCYLIDMSGNLLAKVRTVLRVNEAKRNGVHFLMSVDQADLRALGYESITFDGPVSYSNPTV